PREEQKPRIPKSKPLLRNHLPPCETKLATRKERESPLPVKTTSEREKKERKKRASPFLSKTNSTEKGKERKTVSVPLRVTTNERRLVAPSSQRCLHHPRFAAGSASMAGSQIRVNYSRRSRRSD
ncbi:hypothetical protein V8G54_029566, partial [Vigna mungo]